MSGLCNNDTAMWLPKEYPPKKSEHADLNFVFFLLPSRLPLPLLWPLPFLLLTSSSGYLYLYQYTAVIPPLPSYWCTRPFTLNRNNSHQECEVNQSHEIDWDVVKMPQFSKQPLYLPPLIGVPRPFTLNGNNSHKERKVNQSHEIDFHFYLWTEMFCMLNWLATRRRLIIGLRIAANGGWQIPPKPAQTYLFMIISYPSQSKVFWRAFHCHLQSTQYMVQQVPSFYMKGWLIQVDDASSWLIDSFINDEVIRTTLYCDGVTSVCNSCMWTRIEKSVHSI